MHVFIYALHTDAKTHISSFLATSYFHLFSSTLSPRYNVLHGGRKQPTRFWLSEHTKSFELLGF